MTSVTWLWNCGDSDNYPYVIGNSLCSATYLVHTFPSVLKQQLGFFIFFDCGELLCGLFIDKINKQNSRLILLLCFFFFPSYVYIPQRFPVPISIFLFFFHTVEIKKFLFFVLKSFFPPEVFCSRFGGETSGCLELLAWCSLKIPCEFTNCQHLFLGLSSPFFQASGLFISWQSKWSFSKRRFLPVFTWSVAFFSDLTQNLHLNVLEEANILAKKEIKLSLVSALVWFEKIKIMMIRKPFWAVQSLSGFCFHSITAWIVWL